MDFTSGDDEIVEVRWSYCQSGKRRSGYDVYYLMLFVSAKC